MRHTYAPHANARQARAQARALARASRLAPFHPRGVRPSLSSRLLALASRAGIVALFTYTLASGLILGTVAGAVLEYSAAKHTVPRVYMRQPHLYCVTATGKQTLSNDFAECFAVYRKL
jgi:TRAP-type C4-dicarboxylate transport system permease large subunit